jgi:formylglycine-generating enzyme required for sulfatase activity
MVLALTCMGLALSPAKAEQQQAREKLEVVSGQGCYACGDNETPAKAREAALVLAQEQALRSYRVFVQAPATRASGSGARPTPQAGTDGLNYVWIPAGTFMMGCSPGDSECDRDERPAHQVTISRGFWMGQTEVTVGAYKRFAAATGRAMPSEPEYSGRALNPGWRDESQPMGNVTWDDAAAYCQWAGGRLPTEAEWEHAARAGSSAVRYGDLDAVAWYANNSGRSRLDSARIWAQDSSNYGRRLDANQNGPHPVGRKRPNGLGLYDMLGNTWEWVADWYDAVYYAQSPSEDPRGPSSGQYRVVRGGSWGNYPRIVRVSGRSSYTPGVWNNHFGFRCAREVP